MNALADWGATYGLTAASIILIGILLYVVGSEIVGRIVGRAVTRTHSRTWPKKDVEKRQKTLVGLFTTLWQILVVACVAATVLYAFFPKINLAPLFASAGIIGVAFGFGAQTLVKDFLTGIFIIAENQYRVGDIIEIDGFGGTVERIGSRSTALRDVDGNVHYFPNGMIQHVINKTMGYGMARFSLALDPQSDLDHVITVINDIGATLAEEADWKPKIIEAPKFVFLGDFTATSVDVFVAGKTQPSDQWGVASEMRRRLLGEFDKQGIKLGTVPYFKNAKK